MQAQKVDPKNVRIGDRVRVTFEYEGEKSTSEVTITKVGERRIYSKHFSFGLHALGARSHWELLHRPGPTPAPGTLWRDPATGYHYVATDQTEHGRTVYRRYKNGPSFTLALDRAFDYGHLEPLPPAINASQWETLRDKLCARSAVTPMSPLNALSIVKEVLGAADD